MDTAIEDKGLSRSAALGGCAGVGLVDAVVAAGIGYAVSGAFIWPLFIGVFIVATPVAAAALSFCNAAAAADDAAGCR